MKKLFPDSFEVITSATDARITTILDAAYPESIASIASTLDYDTPAALAGFPGCDVTSDVTTRAAQAIGVFASREVHHGHCLTSLAPAEQPISDEDLVICLTWGQRLPKAKLLRRLHDLPDLYPAFVGPRAELVDVVGEEDFNKWYSIDTARFRQTAYVVCSSKRAPQTRYNWLATKPADITTRKAPVGLVPNRRKQAYKWF